MAGTTSWDELLASPPIDPAVPGPAAEDTALLLYTSGTTGAPKGAMLSHANLITNAIQARVWMKDHGHPASAVYGVMPMFHAYGLTLGLTFAMGAGARLVLFPRFDPDLVLDAVKREPASIFAGAPPIYQKVLARAAERKVSLKGIGLGVSGAMPLPTDLVEPWEEATGGYLIEAYGLSETAPALIANPAAPNRRVGWVGVPISGTEVRIVDPEDPSRVLAYGEEGEVVARGPQVFQGYWRRPAETAATFSPADDGGRDWFRTGDIGLMDERGFVKIVDRIKELVITGGFKRRAVRGGERDPRALERLRRRRHRAARHGEGRGRHRRDRPRRGRDPRRGGAARVRPRAARRLQGAAAVRRNRRASAERPREGATPEGP